MDNLINSPEPIEKRQKSQAGLFIVLALVAILISLGAYYMIYLKQVVAVKDIDMSVVQHSSVDLPKTIETELRNGKTSQVPVEWDTSKVETSKLGTTSITGKVKGYPNTVNCNVNVSHSFLEFKQPRLYIMQNDEDWLSKLPSSIAVSYSDKTIDRSIRWVSDGVDVSKPGKAVVKGVFTDGLNDLDDSINPACKITVVTVNNLLKQMIIKDEFYTANYNDIAVVMSLTSKLPDELIKKVHSKGVKLQFVEEWTVSSDSTSVNGGKVAGEFNPNSLLIKTSPFVAQTLIHEIGHALDYDASIRDYGLLTGSDVFIRAYNAEATKLFNIKTSGTFYPEYYAKQPLEYFAAAFMMYYYYDPVVKSSYKDELRTNAPLTYAYIESIK